MKVCSWVGFDSDLQRKVACTNPEIPGKGECSIHWTGKWEERPGWKMLWDGTDGVSLAFRPVYWRTRDGVLVMGDEDGRGVLHLPGNKRLHNEEAPNGYGDRFDSVDAALDEADRLYPVPSGAAERIVQALEQKGTLAEEVYRLLGRRGYKGNFHRTKTRHAGLLDDLVEVADAMQRGGEAKIAALLEHLVESGTPQIAVDQQHLPDPDQ